MKENNFFKNLVGKLKRKKALIGQLTFGEVIDFAEAFKVRNRIAFGADHPFESSKESLDVLGTLPICDTDLEKFYHGNAEKLFKMV